METETDLYQALEDLQTPTLLKIAERFNIPGNLFVQGSWDGCIFNQITGDKGVHYCAAILKEDPEPVMRVIYAWDGLKGQSPNKTLRSFVWAILTERGVVDLPKLTGRVISVNRVEKFSSTLIDDIPLVSDDDIENFLKLELSRV